MATPEEIRQNMLRLSRIDERLKPSPLSTSDKIWTPDGLVEKPIGWKDSLTPQSQPKVKRGPRGGRYTDAHTQDGRPYRRYF